MFDIREDDLSGDEVRALLAFHLAEARAKTPERSSSRISNIAT